MSPDAYFTPLAGIPSSVAESLADPIFAQVFRRNFDRPGVALINFGLDGTSAGLRRFMIALKDALDARLQRAVGRHLTYISLARFDQQNTTKFHLDGAPDEAYLMLGYEPSPVTSLLAVADYSRAARDWDITPQQLLAERNPMYAAHEANLLPYVTRLEAFDSAAWQVVLFNNSSLPFDGTNSLGVMHQATIPRPMPGESRVVNSIMLGVGDAPQDDSALAGRVRAFRETQEVAGAMD